MYPGGKNGSGTYQQIINFIPKHDLYIELFAGSAAIYFNKLPSGKSILIEKENLQAVTLKNKLLAMVDQVLNIDAISFLHYSSSILELLNSFGMKIFIYADPPYLFSTRKSKAKIYKNELSILDHNSFLSVVSCINVPFMISHYECDLYNQSLMSWNKHQFQSTTRTGTTTDTIYFNYEKPLLLHDNRYLGNDFRERALIKLMRRNIISKLNRLNPQLRNSILSDINNEFYKPS